MPTSVFAWTLNNQPTDPILSLQYPKNQTAFPKMSRLLLRNCAEPSYDSGWIFAETRQRTGDYVLLYGPIWATPDAPGKPKPILEYGTNGVIALIRPDGSCDQLWDADNAFNGFFPGNFKDRPTREEAAIVHVLAVDLIRRAEWALGGKQAFLRALDRTGHGDDQQDSVMIPLLRAIRAGKAEIP
jgi:hypothetical protein